MRYHDDPKAYQHEWYLAHRAECIARVKARRLRLQAARPPKPPVDREAQRQKRLAAFREYYARNREQMRQRARDTAERARLRLADLKAKGCVICGDTTPSLLDFHHRDPATKSFGIASVTRWINNEARLQAELAKCDLLCRRCHAAHHSPLRKRDNGRYA